MLKNKLIIAILFFIINNVCYPHGFVGKRFFPSAITADEPFISDKLALPIFRTEAPTQNGQSSWTTNTKLEYNKTITKWLQASATASYLHIQNPGQKVQNGFNDWVVGLRYNFFLSPQAESIFSVGFNSTLSGTGSHIVNAANYTTLSPEILFAQGLVFMPPALKYLRPIGFSINASPNITTTHYNVDSITWEIAVEYSFPYLQQFIANFNSPWMDHVVPIIELPFTTCTKSNCNSRTTGDIDPGVIIYGNYGQLGLEAIIPSNNDSGNRIGGVVQFYLYLDRMFPNSIGKPIF